jgi:hypothetical protein
MRIEGYAAAHNKHGDENGTCHALKFERRGEHEVATTLCGQGRTSGQMHKSPPEYAPHVCGKCRKVLDRLEREAAGGRRY